MSITSPKGNSRRAVVPVAAAFASIHQTDTPAVSHFQQEEAVVLKDSPQKPPVIFSKLSCFKKKTIRQNHI